MGRFAIVVFTLLAGILTARFMQVQLSAGLAEASGFVRYVDGSSGVDDGSCRNAAAPCKTITYGLNRAVGGDTIRVAQGTYLENLAVNESIILEGGYEAPGWTRDIKKYETIIDGTNGQYQVGDWDGRSAIRPTVVKEGEQYRMWYDGRDVVGLIRQVGTATSTDGKVWTKYDKNPVLGGDKGAWDEFGEHKPFVMKDGSLYKMWYMGMQDGIAQLGYATSSDGIKWTKYGGNPVLEAGPDGYDQEIAGSGSVLFENDTYRLWYRALGDQGEIIAYATSTDGINWDKVGPALVPEDSGWDKYSVWGPSVLKLGETYWMWYSAYTGDTCEIGAVTSSDGLTWTRFRDDSVLSDPGTWCTSNPFVVNDNGTLKMWYEVFYGDPWHGYVNYAESTDGINWTTFAGNPVLSPGDLGQEGSPVVGFDNAGKGAMLDGFTIRNGYAPHGGGVNLRQSEEVTVQNSKIMNNRAVDTGGGMRASELSGLIALNNVIFGNQTVLFEGGGILIDAGSKAIISDNTIYENIAGSLGGGIGSDDHTGKINIVGNEIYDNVSGRSGGGISVANSDGEILISGNDVYANEALSGTGGGVYINEISASNGESNSRTADDVAARIVIDSNHIRENLVHEPYAAGGVSMGQFTPMATVSNNVITGNNGEGVEGANFNAISMSNNTIVDNHRVGVELFAWPEEPADPFTATLNNNIVVGHTVCGISGFNGVVLLLNNNDVWDNDNNYCEVFTGDGNISENPRFVDRNAGDYRLRQNSPAIDAGTNKDAPPYDIDGNPRPFGSGFDIGAYEWPPYRWSLPLILSQK